MPIKLNTSEYKITYLLGAGASAQALPTIKPVANNPGLSQRFHQFVDEIKKQNPFVHAGHKSYHESFINNLLWLADESQKYETIDTFAKFLYLTDREKLNTLKLTLSIYFTIEQLINQKFDKRALIFLTTVLQHQYLFPKNIKVLNWNYDFQIQIAANQFKTEDYRMGAGTYVHKEPLVSYYPKVGQDFITLDELTMVHLNGIAGFYFYRQIQQNQSYHVSNPLKSLNELYEKLKTDSENKFHLMTFAWENDTPESNLLRQRMTFTKQIIADTEILVVIGYSFPYFNREIDKQIMDVLKSSGKLKVIYYQDPFRAGEFLQKQFELSSETKIEHISNVEQYFVPMQL